MSHPKGDIIFLLQGGLYDRGRHYHDEASGFETATRNSEGDR